ncbi:MAG: glycosyltransferase [Deltaproteobacteria bacterium]|nr:glycosyltransferase [Deltaproteobacteria bacterium]
MSAIIFYTHSTPFHPGTILTRGLGGSESALIHMARELARIGHSIHVFCNCDAPGTYDKVIYQNISELPAFFQLSRPDLFVSLRIPQVLAEPIPAQLKWLWAEDSFDQPHIQCLMDPSLVRKIDRVVTVSRWQAETYRRHFRINDEKFYISRNGFHSPFYEGPCTDERPPRLVYSSTPFRGLDVLLNLFPEIRNAVPDAELYIYSSMAVYGVNREEDEKEYGELYRKAEQPGVRLIGTVPQDRLAKELMQSALLAYPNHFAETSCIAAIEAQAAGVPVVTTALGGLNETVRQGETGILIPGDSRTEKYGKQFIGEIVSFLQDREKWRTFSQRARRRAFSEYRWEVIAKEWSHELDRELSAHKAKQAGIGNIGGSKDSISACRNEIARHPDHPEPYHRLGLLYRKAGEPEKALAAFREAISHYVLYDDAYENYRATAEELGITLQRDNLDIVFYTVGNFTPADLGVRAVGGSETALMSMARELARLGRGVIVYNGTQEVSVHEGVEYRNLADFFLLNRWNRIPVFISSRVPMPFRAGVNAERKIFWVHDDCQAEYIRKENLGDLPADEILTVSRWQAETYAEHFRVPRHRFTISRNGIDLFLFPTGEYPRDRNRLLYISRPDRGLSILLDLFPKIREQAPEAELHIFTYTQAQDLESDPEMQPILPKLDQPGVVLRGCVPKEALYNELKKARLLLYPSIWRETSCIAVLEAQAAGLPIVTTPLAALPESVAGGVFVPGNPNSTFYRDRFVEETLRLMRDDTSWRELSERGRAFIRRHHTWAKIASEWDTYLRCSTTRPLLSLCMIVKNEEEVLGRCLKSVAEVVDEIVIVDTGSEDNTCDIAASFGARIIRHNWKDDFSEARNLSLDYARGKWILVLDADEIIAPGDLEKIIETIQNPEVSACSMIQRSYTDDATLLHWKKNDGRYDESRKFSGYIESELIRLFRRRPEIRFRDRIHELVEPSIAEAGLPVERLAIPIHHFGKVRDDDRGIIKGALYRELGEIKMKERPDDPRAAFELAAQMISLKEFAKAIPLLEELVRLKPDSAKPYLLLGTALMELGRNKEAQKRCEEACRIEPESADCTYNLGVVHQRLEQHTKAIDLFRKAIHLQSGHFLAYWSLGFSELITGDSGNAEGHLKESISINPRFASSRNDLAVLYARTGRMELACRELETILDFEPGNEQARQNLEIARAGLHESTGPAIRQNGKISLAVIVKNGEQGLPRCLDSVKDFLDEIVIVDTGSEDKTVEIARRYTDRVYLHPWSDDFSEARNVSINHASSEWILVLDADEWFRPEEAGKLREIVSRAESTITHFYLDRWNLGADGQTGTVMSLPRLFRNHLAGRFEGRIHEQLVIGGKGIHCGLHFLHDGYGRGDDREREKYLRNCRMIEREINADPENPFHYHNLCLSLKALGEEEKAIDAGHRAVDLARAQGVRPRYLVQTCYAAATHHYLKGEMEAARTFAESARTFAPDHPDGWYLLTLIAADQGPWDECIRTGKQFLTVVEKRKDGAVIEPVPVYTQERAHNVMAMIGGAFYRLGNPAEGDAWLIRAIESGRKDLDFIRSIEIFYDAIGETEKAGVIRDGITPPKNEGKNRQKSPNLSLCMIVKNEEEMLAGCLESVQGLVDEIIIIDTGSTDKTVEIARRYTEKIFSHPWADDFSKARNVSIHHATGEWILVLDADEKISAKDHAKIREALNTPGAMAFDLIQRNYTHDRDAFGWRQNRGAYEEEGAFPGHFDVSLTRLFRRNPKIRFVHRVHERVEESLDAASIPHPLLSVPIHHFGKTRGNEFLHRKLEYYLHLAREKQKEDPADSRAGYEIGGTLVELGRTEEALPYLERACRIDPDFREARILLGITLYQLESYERAEQVFASLPPGQEDLPLLRLRGIVSLRLQKGDAAERAFRSALRHDPKNESCRIGLAQAEVLQGKLEDAVTTLEIALRDHPNSPQALNDRGCLALVKGNRQEAERFFRNALNADPGYRDAAVNLDRCAAPAGTEAAEIPKLSVCMMVKNEEEKLPRCLDSIRGYVDELVIVDTGSTDRTVEIARRYTDKIYFHPWEGDFSKARNQALQYAAGDWILQLDADEVVDAADAPRLKTVIQEVPEEITHQDVEILNYDSEGIVNATIHYPRLFRNGMGFHYEGIVHNQIRIEGRRISSGIRIHHYGYALSPGKMEAKRDRTIELLQKQIAADPENPWPHHNLCLSFSMAKMNAKAVEAGEEAYRLARQQGIFPPWLYYGRYVVAATLCADGDYDRAIAVARECMEQNPEHLDSCYLIMLAAYQIDDFPTVREMGDRYLRLLEKYSREGIPADVPLGTLEFKPRALKMLGHASFALGEKERAARLFQDYLQEDMKNPIRYREIGLFYHGQGETETARGHYEKHLTLDPEDTYILKAVADCLTREGDGNNASAYYQKALDLDPSDKEAEYLLEQIRTPAGM